MITNPPRACHFAGVLILVFIFTPDSSSVNSRTHSHTHHQLQMHAHFFIHVDGALISYLPRPVLPYVQRRQDQMQSL